MSGNRGGLPQRGEAGTKNIYLAEPAENTEKNLIFELLAKVFFCGSTSSPRTEKLKNFNLSPFTLSLSKCKLRTFARSSFFNNFMHFFLCAHCELCESHSFFLIEIKEFER